MKRAILMPIDLDFPLSAYIHNKAFVKLGTAYITIINFLKKIGLVFKIMVVVFNANLSLKLIEVENLC